jgi:DNA-binding NtrC family response regulator
MSALEVMKNATHPLALVVDDEELLRLFAAGLLEDHGFEVIEAENAAAALRVLESPATCGYYSRTSKCQGGRTGWT